jgi:hypothetical protein
MEKMDGNFQEKINKKSSLISVWENQHPVMYWWFACTSVSLCSIYIMLFTKF